MSSQPLDRRVEVTDPYHWAQVVKQLVDEDYPDKDRIVLVMDNLNTHHPSSLYEAFEPSRPGASRSGWRLHYRPSMAVGWIWPRLKSG